VGVVTCANDPHGSLGFCLLNNLAIGAAYAVSMYRSKGAPLPSRRTLCSAILGSSLPLQSPDVTSG